VTLSWKEDFVSDWPVGLSTGCFYHRSIFECLKAIRDGGFGMIEVCSSPRHLDYHDLDAARRAADEVRSLGLEAYSLHAPFADAIDITALERDARDHARDEICQAAEAAATMGVRHFVIHPGPEKGGFAEEERFERMHNAADVLAHVAKHCREQGIGFVLENMLPHLFTGHVRDLLWILGALKTTQVGVCLDTGHAFLSGGLLTVAEKLSGHLWMMHASDSHGEYDDHLPPGDGRIPWRSLLQQLALTPFTGAIILEIQEKDDPDEVLEDARRGRRHLRDIARRIGIPTNPDGTRARSRT
jgi:sugar phosphate isomerase/epimerase